MLAGLSLLLVTFHCRINLWCGNSDINGILPVLTEMKVQQEIHCKQGLNLCREIPLDFQSNALTIHNNYIMLDCRYYVFKK